MPPYNFETYNDGYWGNTTSTLDWCEINYEVSWYIAEFYNTLTNLAMIIPGIYGVYQVKANNLETRFLVSFIMLFIVGIGSSMFHMTLQYWAQLLDELPMVYSSCTFIYSLYMINSEEGENSLWLTASLIFYSLFTTVIYLLLPFPIIHQFLYGLTVVVMVYLAAKLLLQTEDKPNRIMFVAGVMTFLLAFGLWNIDNFFCTSIEKFRQTMLSKLISPLSQLHGWWHLLTGYATYMNIQFCVYNRAKYLDQNPTYSCDIMGISVDVQHRRKIE